MRNKLFRWLFGWCFFPKCECNLNAGEMKCFRRVDRTGQA
jgi:hypothetical protein